MMKTALFLVTIALSLLSGLFPQLPLGEVISLLCLGIVISVFASIQRFIRLLGGAFLGIGCLLLALDGAPWYKYLLSFGGMLNILCLFALVPLVAIPIQLGQYADRVQTIIQRRVRHSGLLYAITSFLSYLFSSFMSVAALPMVYQTIRPSIELYPIAEKERFMSRAITHGFGMPLIWTPITPMVGIVVEMTGVRWGAILPIVVPLSILGLFMDWLTGLWLANRRQRRLGEAALRELAASRESAAAAASPGAQAKHPIQIIVVILAFNLLLSMLERFTDISFLLLVTISVLPFAWCWAALIGKRREFAHAGKKAVPEQLRKMKDQFFVFLSAGFMIAACQATGADHTISLLLNDVKDAIGPGFFLILIPLLPFVMAYIGIHPAVALTLAAESLNPETLGISVELVAVAMLTGAATSFLVGPYNATVGIMSGLVGRSAYRVSNWNLPFTAVFLLVSMLVLFFLQKGG
ncbi:hypothetical protein MO973_22735 [Paenibacillus sp. TRM 82003]|nr:hypothetical protein [Paenibacillus sp. TRM 82003]